MVAGLAAWLPVAPAVPPVAAVLSPQADACGGQSATSGQVYLGAWIPAALDDPRAPCSADSLRQFEARAGKGVRACKGITVTPGDSLTPYESAL